MSGRGVQITFRDLRIARLNKRVRTVPCAGEMEAYMNAMSRVGENGDRVPKDIRKDFSDCMAVSVSF